MAGNKKNIVLTYSDSGETIYAMILKEAVGNQALTYFDYSDGTFKAVPTTPYIPLVEDSVIKGMYIATENRFVWDSGKYTIAFFKQAGASPAPTTDDKIPVEKQDFVVDHDTF